LGKRKKGILVGGHLLETKPKCGGRREKSLRREVREWLHKRGKNPGGNKGKYQGGKIAKPGSVKKELKGKT